LPPASKTIQPCARNRSAAARMIVDFPTPCSPMMSADRRRGAVSVSSMNVEASLSVSCSPKRPSRRALRRKSTPAQRSRTALCSFVQRMSSPVGTLRSIPTFIMAI
jgi:hypothetical protein